MKADSHYEGVQGVREPCVKLVRGGGQRGRGDMEALDRALQVLPIGFIPHGPGGGALVGWCRKVDEDGGMVRPGRGQGGGIPGPEGRADEWAGEGEVNGAGPKGAREGEPGVNTRGVEEGVGQVSGPVEVRCGGFFFGTGDDPQGVDSMVVYVEVPGSQAEEINVGEGVGGVNRFHRPRKRAGVDIGESELGGAGAETAGRGVNVEVKNIRRGG